MKGENFGWGASGIQGWSVLAWSWGSSALMSCWARAWADAVGAASMSEIKVNQCCLPERGNTHRVASRGCR